MATYAHLKDNEDGTTTMTTNLIDGLESVVIIPLSLSEMFARIDTEAINAVAGNVMDGAVIIPDEVD